MRFVYSPDGAQIAIERGETESDVVLLKDTSRMRTRPSQNTGVTKAGGFYFTDPAGFVISLLLRAK